MFASGYSTNTIYKITFCPPLTSTTYDTICASALPFTWNGKTLTGAGTLRDTLTSAAGYDSIAVLNLIIKPSPTVYNLTGGGSFCAGGAGVPVVLSGSQTSVHYSVFVNGVLNPKYKQGTGSPLSGTLQNPGTYTMKATDTITGCTANMTGSVTVIVNQPTTSSISISNCGSYTWHNKVLTSTGTYYDTLKAANSSGCDSIITLNLTIKNSPTVYTLSGGGSFCAGGAGVPVSLSGSQTSVFYTVFINGIATNDTVNGMGIPLSGKLQYPGIYTLKANDTITGCMVFMNGSVTVIVNQPTISVTTINNCDNYVWHNKVLTNSGVYHDTLKGANSNGCDSITTLNLTISPSVSGNIISPLWKPIPSVIATLKSNNMVYNTYSNNYKFTCTNNGSNDTIHLTKNNDVNKANGVTALDIALVQSHILGKSILSSPYKIIAADVSGDGKVTALDIVYLKRLILGIDTTFTNSTTKQTRLWTFVDSSYKFPDTTNPFPYKDSIVVTGLSTSKTNQTFIGCKMGDVNWDWNPAIARPMVNNIDAVELSYSLANTYPSDALAGRTDGYVHIPIRVKNFREMLGMQYTISFNASVLKWVGVDNNVLNFEMGTNHAEEGKISFLWVDTKNEIKTLEDGSVIMELVFKTIKPFNNETLDLDGSVTSVVAYDKDYQMHNVMFKPSVINSLETKDVWSVAPNPTTEGVIHLQMNLADRKIVVLRLIDNTGRLLLVKQVEGVKGINIITLKEGNVPSGTYYLQAVGVEGVKQILIQ